MTEKILASQVGLLDFQFLNVIHNYISLSIFPDMLQIGHLGMTSKEITENIVSTGFYIMKYFPGGWNNIRSLHIKGQRTAAVPIYLSLGECSLCSS